MIEKDRFAAAIPLLRQAADLDPQEARTHHYLGYALWKTRQWSAASAEFETAHKLEPGNPYTEYFQARIAIPKAIWNAPSSYTRPQSHPATRFLTRINDWGKHTHAKESLRKLWTSRDWRFSKRLGMERFTINSGRFTAKWDARRKLSRSLNQASERSVLIRCRSKSYWSSLGQSGEKRSIERLSCAENC